MYELVAAYIFHHKISDKTEGSIGLGEDITLNFSSLFRISITKSVEGSYQDQNLPADEEIENDSQDQPDTSTQEEQENADEKTYITLTINIEDTGIKNIFRKTEDKIINFNAFIGNNGSGKSTTMRFLRYALGGKVEHQDNKFLLIYFDPEKYEEDATSKDEEDRICKIFTKSFKILVKNLPTDFLHIEINYNKKALFDYINLECNNLVWSIENKENEALYKLVKNVDNIEKNEENKDNSDWRFWTDKKVIFYTPLFPLRKVPEAEKEDDKNKGKGEKNKNANNVDVYRNDFYYNLSTDWMVLNDIHYNTELSKKTDYYGALRSHKILNILRQADFASSEPTRKLKLGDFLGKYEELNKTFSSEKQNQENEDVRQEQAQNLIITREVEVEIKDKKSILFKLLQRRGRTTEDLHAIYNPRVLAYLILAEKYGLLRKADNDVSMLAKDIIEAEKGKNKNNEFDKETWELFERAKDFSLNIEKISNVFKATITIVGTLETVKNKGEEDSIAERSFVDNPNNYKIKGGDDIYLSSGQKSIMDMYSRIYFILRKLNFVNNSNNTENAYNNENQQTVYIFLDEPETSFHPEWQRRFVWKFIDFLNNTLKDNIKAHVFIASHSPLLISDIPREHIIFLKKEQKVESDKIGKNIKQITDYKELPQTFASNVTDILANGFFLDNGLIGEYAKRLIERNVLALFKLKELKEKEESQETEVLEALKKQYNKLKTGKEEVTEQDDKKNSEDLKLWDKEILDKVKQAYNIVNSIGDKVLKGMLKGELERLFDKELKQIRDEEQKEFNLETYDWKEQMEQVIENTDLSDKKEQLIKLLEKIENNELNIEELLQESNKAN